MEEKTNGGEAMSVKELSQLYYLNREIERDMERLEELKAKSAGVQSPQITGMPHGSGFGGSQLERCMAEIVDLEAIILAKQMQCLHERARLERYISRIEDSETRLIFTLRFVDGLPWEQVARCLGEGHTADRAKKVCYRYLGRIGTRKK